MCKENVAGFNKPTPSKVKFPQEVKKEKVSLLFIREKCRPFLAIVYEAYCVAHGCPQIPGKSSPKLDSSRCGTNRGSNGHNPHCNQADFASDHYESGNYVKADFGLKNSRRSEHHNPRSRKGRGSTDIFQKYEFYHTEP